MRSCDSIVFKHSINVLRMQYARTSKKLKKHQLHIAKQSKRTLKCSRNILITDVREDLM